MNKVQNKFFWRRVGLVVTIVVLATVAFASINPIGWNQTVRAIGISQLALNDPYIEFGSCKLYDSETVSYADGMWTTSSGCKSKAEQAVGEDSIAYVNGSSYRFDLTGSTVDTPVSLLQGGGECVMLLGFTVPGGVRLYPGCTGWLLVDQPASYTLDFLPSFPSLEYSNSN